MSETKSVHRAWADVMGDVQAIRKADRNQQQGWVFRGIDAVMSAVGPALRKHGVLVIPESLSMETERYQTAKGGQMQGVIVHMRYTIYGPAGDHFAGSAYGQAADSGDKAVTKAESVAYRTFLLQSLTIPTDDPEPDQSVHERAAQQHYRQAPGITDAQQKKMHALFSECGVTDRAKRLEVASWHCQRTITTSSDMSAAEASALIQYLSGRAADMSKGNPIAADVDEQSPGVST